MPAVAPGPGWHLPSPTRSNERSRSGVREALAGTPRRFRAHILLTATGIVTGSALLVYLAVSATRSPTTNMHSNQAAAHSSSHTDDASPPVGAPHGAMNVPPNSARIPPTQSLAEGADKSGSPPATGDAAQGTKKEHPTAHRRHSRHRNTFLGKARAFLHRLF
jgi:hypothetical protein